MIKIVDGIEIEMTPEETEAWETQMGTHVSSLSLHAVKAECRRRILAIMSEDQQRNTLAVGQAAVMQFGADPAGWPDDLRERHKLALSAWSEIERLRARSNQIEAMQPLPVDITMDDLWT